MYTPIQTLNAEDIRGLGSGDLTTGQVFSRGVSEGMTAGPTGALQKLEAIGLDQPYLLSGDTIIDNPIHPKPLTEEEWKASRMYRDGLTYEPGMTDYRAALLAAQVDKKEQDAYVDAHWSGFGKGAVKVLGNLAGSALDPTNYIPMLGEAALTESVGRVAAGAISGAATNAGIVAAGQGLDMVAAHELQQDPDWHAAALNVGIAALFGVALGSLSGFLSKQPVESRISATAKALDDMSQGRPVNVEPVLRSDPAVATEGKADFTVGAPKETPIPELETAKVTGAASKGTEKVDIGVAPEKVAEVEARFKDLEAAPETVHLTEAADISEQVKPLQNQAKAWLSAAMCLAREVF